MRQSVHAWLVGGLLLSTMTYALAEDITLTTYYPSPRGVYQTLRSTGQTTLAETGGNVGIGTTAPSYRLMVLANQPTNYAAFVYNSSMSANADGLLIRLDQNGPNNIALGVQDGANPPYFVVHGTGTVGIGTTSPTDELHVVGDIFATGTISVPSDARFKRDVIPLTGALEKLDGLQAISFERNALAAEVLGDEAPGPRELGLLAQELEQVYPELVTRHGEEAYRAVDYSKLTVVLLEAIKELQAEVERLQAEQRRLQERLKVLEAADQQE